MDNPIPALNLAEVRVLGALVEKQITTPDYYPLTLNALVNACNQLTNREPVVAFDETTVTSAIDGLRAKRLAAQFQGAESRVAKYKHALTDALLLTPVEVALLCVLMLRGPRPSGELRTRAERMFTFESLAEVGEVLHALSTRQPQALVAKLPRQPARRSRVTSNFWPARSNPRPLSRHPRRSQRRRAHRRKTSGSSASKPTSSRSAATWPS